MGQTKVNYNALQDVVNSLKTKMPDEAEATEFSNRVDDSLGGYSSKHDNFLKDYIGEETTAAHDLLMANTAYNDYLNALSDTAASFAAVDSDDGDGSGASQRTSSSGGIQNPGGIPTSTIVGLATTNDKDSTSDEDDYVLSDENWADLPGGDKDKIIKKLEELGFTDDEIINIKEGKVSVDKAKLELLSSELEELYKKDPSIRQKLIDLYGFDIFNDDGTINKEKLALAMLMDDKNKNDKYDLSLLINKLKASSSKSLSGLETSVDNISKVNTAKISSNVGKTAVAGGTVAGAIGGISSVGKATSKGNYGTDAQALETESNKTELTKQEDSDDSLINTGLEKEASKLIKKIKPTTSGDIKKQGGAAMVAAGLAATGAIGGGGAVIVKKTMMLKFTPEDWARQPQNIKDAVLADFKAVGFQPSQIELFEKSTLKIKAKLVDDVIFSIRKAQILDESIKEKLNSTYKFSVFNEENKISRYLVLLVMLIDGKRATDDVSIYNILNNILSDTNYSNYIYTGTTLEEIVVTEEEKKEAEERKQKEEEENKITDKKENNKSTQMEEKDIKTQKEWLESIGILDNL